MRRRFTRPVFLWAILALMTKVKVERMVHAGSAPRALLALPVLPLLFFMIAMVLAIRRMDELQKRICLESSSIAFVLTLGLAFIQGGLESAGMAASAFDFGSIAMFLWACAYVFSSWRYR